MDAANEFYLERLILNYVNFLIFYYKYYMFFWYFSSCYYMYFRKVNNYFLKKLLVAYKASKLSDKKLYLFKTEI